MHLFGIVYVVTGRSQNAKGLSAWSPRRHIVLQTRAQYGSSVTLVAAEPGFEPGREAPKAPVLPLHYSARLACSQIEYSG